ncbi:hypothetical protein I203_102905 [Kwoniella mangroviensis CBS 8507]|uniref:uncharacterized protein n=1 Tax=Kwoniella mangroviensis CBS 8507 TaxID=1296122 RepID=UPI00080D1FB5|nr:uncharacterized protein I203_03879 [Kwoniella mangroviensis CBS 8507]OCF67192.1 hypothetical protein I203_03879 [Kwoniella mangroviensis CBS 8507]
MTSIATASASTPPTSDLLSILPQLLTTLQSPTSISIPPATLLGAITHFLSQIDSPHLHDFISALISSPTLWSHNGISAEDIRNAIRLSIPAKISKIHQETADVYFKETRRRRKAREWLGVWLDSLSDDQDGTGAIQTRIGLLQGLDDTPEIDWGKGRVKLEETMILSLAEKFQTPSTPDCGDLIAVIPHIAVDRLQALDIKAVTSQIESNLYQELDHFSPSTETVVLNLSRALARSWEVSYSGGPSSRKYAKERMISFCEQMQEKTENLESEWQGNSGSKTEDANDPVWLKNKTTFFSFLTVASTIIDIVLSHPNNSIPTDRNGLDPLSAADIAINLLTTLGSFAYFTDTNQGTFENYYKILYASLDIASGQGGDEGVSALFEKLCREGKMSDAKAGYVLVLGEELIHHLGKKEIDLLLPLAERHAHKPTHKGSFEASHAFLLALIRTSSEGLSRNDAQTAFFDSLLPNYINIIIKQYSQKHISSEQFRQAFPLIVESASKRSPPSVAFCLSYLSTLKPNPDIRHIRVTITPFIDSARLPGYLEDLAQMILTTEKNSEERMDLTRNAFEMVVKDLSDKNKHVGIDWWINWKDRFAGRGKEVGFIRSRL